MLLRVHQEALTLNTSEQHAKGGTEAGDGPDTGLIEQSSGCKRKQRFNELLEVKGP